MSLIRLFLPAYIACVTALTCAAVWPAPVSRRACLVVAAVAFVVIAVSVVVEWLTMPKDSK